MATWPNPNAVAKIYAGSMIYSAWESLTVKRDYGKGISVFAFAPVEDAYGPGMSQLKIAPGEPVTITLAGLKAFTGWVKERLVSYDKQSHQIVVTGESMTTDLVHSSVVVKPGTYGGSTAEQAIRSVLAPHPVSLVMANPPPAAATPFTSLAVQYGEKVAAFIERVAVARNMFITDDENGNLVVGQANPNFTICAELREGRNILRATGKLLDPSACRWNKFNGVSQTVGTDGYWPPRANSATATAPEIRSNLFGLFVAEAPSDAQELTARVQHGAMRALWPMMDVTVTVPGWLRPDGKLWATAPEASAFVSIYSPMIFPNVVGGTVMGIQGITFQQDSTSGTTTTLNLVHPNALTHAPISDLVGPNGGAPPVNTTAQPDPPDWQVNTAGGAQ